MQLELLADMGGELHIYNSDGESVWYKSTSTNSQLGKRQVSKIVTILPGTYYLRFKEYSDPGNYSFSIISYNATKGPAKVNLSSVKSSKKKTVTIKWKKLSEADGYQIQYSKSKKFKNGKTITVNQSIVKKW